MDKELKQQLESMFRDIRIADSGPYRTVISAEREAVLALLSFLKGQGYAHLALISCVDWIDEEQFELVYILSPYLARDDDFSKEERTTVLVKTRIDRDNPHFITAIPLFKNAEPYEREIHELYGVTFAGHPRLTSLFLERHYEIPPFRKDFDTRKYVRDVFDAVPDVKDEAAER